MAASTKLTPEERIERARLAGRASHQSPERHVRALERMAGDITPEQALRLLRVLAQQITETVPR